METVWISFLRERNQFNFWKNFSNPLMTLNVLNLILLKLLTFSKWEMKCSTIKTLKLATNFVNAIDSSQSNLAKIGNLLKLNKYAKM